MALNIINEAKNVSYPVEHPKPGSVPEYLNDRLRKIEEKIDPDPEPDPGPEPEPEPDTFDTEG